MAANHGPWASSHAPMDGLESLASARRGHTQNNVLSGNQYMAWAGAWTPGACEPGHPKPEATGCGLLTSTCHRLPSALTTRPSMGRRQAPQMGTPILSWQGRQ